MNETKLPNKPCYLVIQKSEGVIQFNEPNCIYVAIFQRYD
jgi:hypothetical protein